MSNRVYTYTKVSELKNAPYFKEIAPLPQLTLSREMAVNMSYDMKIFKGNIMGFLNFSQRLFPGWNTSGQKFVYVTALNRFLRDKIAAVHDRAERDWLFGCKKNLIKYFDLILSKSPYDHLLTYHISILLQSVASNGVQGVQTRLKRKDRFESK